MIKQIWNPDLYHGHKKKRNYFEGWYFKITDKENKYSLAIIPGIIKGKKKKEGHSFIQIMDEINHRSYYIKFKKEAFKAKQNKFQFDVSKNTFSLNEIILNYNKEDLTMIGNLRIFDVTQWPSTKLNPGSMGYYNYLIFLECYSQVCCLDGSVVGKVLINKEEIDFSGGKVYIEKNWGSNFPQAYIWVQANGFKKQDVAVSISLAKIPLWSYRFNGFLAAFKFGKKIYKFTTMNKSKINLEFIANNVELSFEKNGIKLIVETLCKEDDFLVIKGPDVGKMDIDIKESIKSDVHVELIDLNKNIMLFEGVGKNSGVEFMGNLRELQN